MKIELSEIFESLIDCPYLCTMKLRFIKPSRNALRVFLSKRGVKPVTYWEKGATAWERMPFNFQHFETEKCIGRGELVWRCAKKLFFQLRYLPDNSLLYPANVSVKQGNDFVLVCNYLGVYFCNPLRIIEVQDSADTCSIIVGTLPGHVVRGEERFLLTKKENGDVYFKIRLFSLPDNSLVRFFGTSLVNSFQNRFRQICITQLETSIQKEMALSKQIKPLPSYGSVLKSY